MSEMILILDDVTSQLRMVEYSIQHRLGYATITAQQSDTVMECFMQSGKPRPDLLLLDLTLQPNGLDVVRSVKQIDPQLPVIALVAYGDNEYAADAIAAGISDFLTKPVTLERLNLSLKNALRVKRLSQHIVRLERNMTVNIGLTDIISESPGIKKALSLSKEASGTTMPVRIEGEAGTGKEMFARAIHVNSVRFGKPFVAVYCQAFPESPDEPVFTGPFASLNQHCGEFLREKWREADHGTLFLKDAHLLSDAMQSYVLALMEEQAHDIRFIIATSPGFEQSVMNGRYNAALFNRLRGICLVLPPLRKRLIDIAPLADYFLMMYALSENKQITGLTPSALEWLKSCDWPGNVRQLANTMWRAVMAANDGMIDLNALQNAYSHPPLRLVNDMPAKTSEQQFFLDAQGRLKTLRHLEAEAIRFALRHANGCMTRAAKALGIGRSTLYRKLEEMAVGKAGYTPGNMVDYISRASHTTRPTI